MRTAIFIGLIAIAQAIRGESLFDAEYSTDVLITSIVCSIMIISDIFVTIKKYFSDK